MVALNFSAEFAGPVSRGLKRQTIRRDFKGRPGDRVQLYTGQRTKHCVKLVAMDPVILSVERVTFSPFRLIVGVYNIHPDEWRQFARADGFEDFGRMWHWFSQRYECEEFSGKLIKWQSWTEGRDGDA